MTDSNPSGDQFIPPKTMDDAEERLADISDECVLIQAQLSNQNHNDENGRRLTAHEYHQWRARATWALAKKRIEQRKLKRWIDARKQAAFQIESGVTNPSNVVELMGALVKIVKTNNWSDLTPQEQAVLELATRWIRSKGAPALVTAREHVEAAS